MNFKPFGKPRPRILIVEDEALIAMDLQMTLEAIGATPLGAAASGEESIRRAADLRPDLILMDINLKGTMDGIHAAGEIHRRFGIPVVFLTGFSDDSTVGRLSPFAFLFKPFDASELKTAVWKHLGPAPALSQA